MSDKYIALVRIEPAQVVGKGADRGEVIALREPDSRITKTEKRRLLVLKLNLTKAEYQVMQGQVRPQTTFAPIGTPPEDPDKAEAWMAAMEAERKKLHKFSLRVELESLGLKMTKVDDLTCAIEPVSVTKDKIVVKPAKAKAKVL